MNVILTGCAGFIGSHLAEMLCLQGWNVYGIDNLSNGKLENLKGLAEDGKFTFIESDVCNIQNIKFPTIDCIIHLAAIGSVPRSMRDPDIYMQNNVVGFHRVLEFARLNHVKTLFYASSSSVYGNQQKFYRYETDEPAPCSPYAASKLINEVMAQTYERAFWITCHGLRFFNVFGPRQRFDSDYAAVVPKFCKGILEKGEIQIFGDGKQVRTFTPVSFVAEAITHMVANPGDLKKPFYNVTSPDYAASVIETATLIGRIINAPFKVDYLPLRDGDVKSSIGSGRELAESIGMLSPDHPMVEAMKETVDWYKAKLSINLS